MSAARWSMLLMAVSGALWALLEAAATHLSRAYSPFQVVWTRYAVHLGFMLIVWGWREPRSLLATRRPVLQFARSSLMLIMPLSFVVGLVRGLEPGVMMATFWVAPLLMVLLGSIVLKESASSIVWLAAAGSVAGAALLASPGVLPPLRFGLVWPLIMATSFSLYVVLTRLLRSEPTRANLFYTALGVFLALTPVMPFVWITPTAHDFALLAAVGLLGWASLLCLDRLAALAPVAESAPLSPLQGVAVLVLGVAAGHFQPHPEVWAGLALLAVVVAVMWWHPTAPEAQST